MHFLWHQLVIILLRFSFNLQLIIVCLVNASYTLFAFICVIFISGGTCNLYQLLVL